MNGHNEPAGSSAFSPLSLNDYQEHCMRTCTHPRGSSAPFALAWNALGLTGEAGEVADLIKKVIGHGHALDVEKLKLELGDVLWYIAALANDLGITLQDIAEANIEKLKKRYPNGFQRADSINRQDH